VATRVRAGLPLPVRRPTWLVAWTARLRALRWHITLTVPRWKNPSWARPAAAIRLEEVNVLWTSTLAARSSTRPAPSGHPQAPIQFRRSLVIREPSPTASRSQVQRHVVTGRHRRVHRARASAASGAASLSNRDQLRHVVAGDISRTNPRQLCRHLTVWGVV